MFGMPQEHGYYYDYAAMAMMTGQQQQQQGGEPQQLGPTAAEQVPWYAPHVYAPPSPPHLQQLRPASSAGPDATMAAAGGVHGWVAHIEHARVGCVHDVDAKCWMVAPSFVAWLARMRRGAHARTHKRRHTQGRCGLHAALPRTLHQQQGQGCRQGGGEQAPPAGGGGGDDGELRGPCWKPAGVRGCAGELMSERRVCVWMDGCFEHHIDNRPPPPTQQGYYPYPASPHALPHPQVMHFPHAPQH